MQAGLKKKKNAQTGLRCYNCESERKKPLQTRKKKRKVPSALKEKVLKKKNCFYVSCSAANKCVKADMIILILACSVNSVLSL